MFLQEEEVSFLMLLTEVPFLGTTFGGVPVAIPGEALMVGVETVLARCCFLGSLTLPTMLEVVLAEHEGSTLWAALAVSGLPLESAELELEVAPLAEAREEAATELVLPLAAEAAAAAARAL